jgi:hypothetical protein
MKLVKKTPFGVFVPVFAGKIFFQSDFKHTPSKGFN